MPPRLSFLARLAAALAARLAAPVALLVLAACLSSAARAQEPATAAGALVLPAARAAPPAWPATRLLADPARALTPDAAFAARARFTPAGDRKNLGRADGALWLHLPLQAEPGQGTADWWLAIDYASLDRVDVHVWHAGRLVQQARLGDHLPVAGRPAATRQHAVALRLVPGERHDVLLRVETTSSLILPLRLLRSAELAADEGRQQTLQGLATGLGLMVLVFAVAGLWLMRDPVFLWFALTTVSSTLFFAAYTGWAPLLLWPGSGWLTRNAAPLMMVLLIASGTLFIDRSLDMRQHAPRTSWAMRVLAGVALATALLFAAGVLGYHTVSAITSAIGLLPGLLALSVSFRRSRAGDRIAQLTFAGWVIYALGVVSFTLLHAGRIPFGPWTATAFQLCSILELLAWTAILVLRTDRLREQAAVTRRENQHLIAMTQTDPLTGLLNRRGLAQALQGLLPASSAQQMVAVYVIDLDGFKAVNDRHGHRAGDELLVQVGARLRHALRTSDLVARTGGDEFVVVAGSLHHAQEAAQIGRKLLACTDQPFQLAGAACRVGMTVGYALAPADGRDAEALVGRADAAMYAGKQAGKHRVNAAQPAPG